MTRRPTHRIGIAMLSAVALGACFGGTPLESGKAAPPLAEAKEPARAFDGTTVILSELVKRGPVMLVFLRGCW